MGTGEPRLTSQTLKVLALLTARTEPEMSGADIGRATKLASGTLYPILFRLEQARWVESHCEAEDPEQLGRPRRRLYRITALVPEKPSPQSAKWYSHSRSSHGCDHGSRARCDLLSAFLSRLVAGDFKAWIHRITQCLIWRAVAAVPAEQRPRYEEEWNSHINDVPGGLGKLFVSFSLLWAARDMSAILAGKRLGITKPHRKYSGTRWSPRR